MNQKRSGKQRRRFGGLYPPYSLGEVDSLRESDYSSVIIVWRPLSQSTGVRPNEIELERSTWNWANEPRTKCILCEELGFRRTKSGSEISRRAQKRSWTLSTLTQTVNLFQTRTRSDAKAEEKIEKRKWPVNLKFGIHQIVSPKIVLAVRLIKRRDYGGCRRSDLIQRSPFDSMRPTNLSFGRTCGCADHHLFLFLTQPFFQLKKLKKFSLTITGVLELSAAYDGEVRTPASFDERPSVFAAARSPEDRLLPFWRKSLGTEKFRLLAHNKCLLDARMPRTVTNQLWLELVQPHGRHYGARYE